MSMATLAILPPLHQDFRARKFLCSPGDGWRQYKPPPPPTVQPAFHFLVSLLEADAYAPLHPRVILRPVLDSRMYGKLQRALDLPTEVLARIVELVTEDGNGLDLALGEFRFALSFLILINCLLKYFHTSSIEIFSVYDHAVPLSQRHTANANEHRALLRYAGERSFVGRTRSTTLS